MERRPAGRFATAAAEAKRIVRRAGGAYNRSDDACLRSALGAAAGQGCGTMHSEWGAWRFRFHFSGHGHGASLVHVEQAADAPQDDAAMDVEEQAGRNRQCFNFKIKGPA